MFPSRGLLLAVLSLTACSGGSHPAQATGSGAAGASTAAGTGGHAGTGGAAGAGGRAGTGGDAGTAGATGEGGAVPDAGDAGAITTTRTALLSNDTSAATTFVDVYTPATRFNGSTTPVSNYDAPTSTTPLADMAQGIVSKVPLRTLLYGGAATTTKVFVETQAWFCTNGDPAIPTTAPADQCGSHIDVGYDANAAAHVQAEVADMVSRGFDGAVLDWQGTSAGTGNGQHATSVAAINAGNATLLMKAAEATEGKFQFALQEDEGMNACAAQSGCDVTTQIVSDVSFIAANYFPSPAYQTLDGRPVVYFFGVDYAANAAGKTIDWTTVRAGVTGNPVFIFENAGGFTHADTDGAYAWPDPTAIASYPGSDPFGLKSFLPYFYGQAGSHATLHVLGSAYKGFDDLVVNGWGGGERYIGQQCGKTWLDTFAAPSADFPATHPLEAIEVATWDDYEEGTEIETGIESWAQIDASATGATLGWTVTAAANAPADCTTALAGGFSLEATIHHFDVYASPAGDGENLTLVAGDLPASATSLDLTGKLPAGAYVLYVYAVSQPSIRNHLSAAVPWG